MGRARRAHREGGREDYLSQPGASALSNEFAQLPLRGNAHSFRHLPALDRRRSGTGPLSLHLPRNFGPIWTEDSTRHDASLCLRIPAVDWRPLPHDRCNPCAFPSGLALTRGGRESRATDAKAFAAGRERHLLTISSVATNGSSSPAAGALLANTGTNSARHRICLLYTSDAADERSSVDLG